MHSERKSEKIPSLVDISHHNQARKIDFQVQEYQQSTVEYSENYIE